jgi:hypothetical protein
LKKVQRECRPDRSAEEGPLSIRNWQKRQTRQDNEGRQEVNQRRALNKYDGQEKRKT